MAEGAVDQQRRVAAPAAAQSAAQSAARVRQRVHDARRGLDPEERRRVMDAVALRTEDGWLLRFGVMLALSVVVAVMGLSAGSAAVVIGAMLLAPLMTPVMGAAAALAMALPRHLLRSGVVVVAATAGGLLLAFVLALLLPDGPLSDEVLARTSPDLRDLLVALAAGAAGAYATVRPDVSSSLPGVAVAVALVPPLATAGMTLEAGRGDLVGGAALLYAANLLAIILVATLVFLATGFVPRRRLATRGATVIGGELLLTLATLAVAVPLALASVAAAEAGSERQRLHDAASSWMQGTGDDLDEVRVDGDVVRIRMSGPNPPPVTDELERAVEQILGSSARLEVRWTQTQKPPSPDAPRVGGFGRDGAPTAAAVRREVDAWMSAAGATVYEVARLELRDGEVRLDLVSPDPPPGVDELVQRLSANLDFDRPVAVHWTRGTTLRSGAAPTDTSPTQVERRLRTVARAWARGHDGVVVSEVAFDGVRATVELLGPGPLDVAELEARLRRVAGDHVLLDIWLTRRERLGTR